MDFVSAHHGAIPDSAMRSPGQFEHPLVRRAKLEIAAACHAHGKTPSHNVTTEVRDMSVVAADARARDEFAFTRMWSIHPAQIRPIVDAFAPRTDEVALAAEILLAAQAADCRRATVIRCTIARVTAITGRCCAAHGPPASPCRPRPRRCGPAAEGGAP